MQKRDYYKILEVSKNATDEELKKSFRKLSLKYHPDRQNGKSDEEKKSAEEKFKEIAEAYSVLSDKDKRRRYDMFGPEGANQNGGFGGHNVDPREFFRRHMQNFGFGADFNVFGNFGSFGFGDGFSSQDNNPNGPQDGEDIQIQIHINLEDSLYGSKKKYHIEVEDPCDHCHGTGSEDGKTSQCSHCNGTGMMTQRHGMMVMSSTCPYCHGRGVEISNPCHECHGKRKKNTIRDIELEIPQGISSGDKLMIKGKGQKGFNGGNDGDVIVYIEVDEHELFKRNGMNLGTVINIPSLTAIMGGDIDVNTPWGVATVNIPKGITQGKQIRLNGMGVRKGTAKGNLNLIVNIENITNLTDEQRELLEKLRGTITENNFTETRKRNNIFKEFEKKVKKLRGDS